MEKMKEIFKNISIKLVGMKCELKGKNVLVTGGAGFIGSHLVDALGKEELARLVVVDNLFLGKEGNLENARKVFPDLIFEKVSAADEDAMKRIVEENEINIIFNLAAIPLPISLEDPKFCSNENIAITQNILELLRKRKIETLVHFSSSEVYGSLPEGEGLLSEKDAIYPITPYAASKAACDYLVQSYAKTFDLDTLIIRPFNNFGPRQNDKSYAGVIPLTVKRLMNDESPIIFGDGFQTRDFLYVEDTANNTIKLFKTEEARGKIINLGSGKEITMKNLIKIMKDQMGSNKEDIHEDPRPGDVRRLLSDVTLAKEIIDFSPKIGIKEGLAKTIEWYKSMGRDII
jgi:UDP-glucose 4-epimerase